MKEARMDEFRILKTLGAGFQAKVKLAASPEGDLFAIKKFKRDTYNPETLNNEVSLMKKLKHPGLVEFVSYRQKANYLKKSGTTETCDAIIMEYMKGGQLFNYISFCGRFKPDLARTYFHQLFDALQYMHSIDVYHRDIKPENVLVSENYSLKLSDFGFSTSKRARQEGFRTLVGTDGYKAPEVNGNTKYDPEKADLFAICVVLFIMYSGHPPFQRAEPTDPYFKLICLGRWDIFWQAHQRKKDPGFYEDSFKSLVERMLAHKPENRMTLKEVKAHAWMAGDQIMLNSVAAEMKARTQKIAAQKIDFKAEKVRDLCLAKLEDIEHVKEKHALNDERRVGAGEGYLLLHHSLPDFLAFLLFKVQGKRVIILPDGSTKGAQFEVCVSKEFAKAKVSCWLHEADQEFQGKEGLLEVGLQLKVRKWEERLFASSSRLCGGAWWCGIVESFLQYQYENFGIQHE